MSALSSSPIAAAPPISTAQAWLLAIRPKTLPAAVGPVVLGTAVAHHEGGARLGPAVAALLGALLLQIASNLANDLFDHQRGADGADRLGPTRMVSAGVISPSRMKRALVAVLALAMVAGAYLLSVAGPMVAVIGIVSIITAIAYTGGPYPLAYHGLGEVFVFAFFGWVAVVGTAYVQLHTYPVLAWFAGASQGSLAVNILVVNNLRDRNEDARVGKRTLAVRFGERFCLAQYAAFLGVAYIVPVVVWATTSARWPVLIPLVSLPLAVRLYQQVATTRGVGLNALLARTAQLMLLFGILFSLGVATSS